MSRTKPRAALTAAPIAGTPGATTYAVDCRHGTTSVIVMPAPGTPPPSPHGWIVLAICNLTIAEGCDCAAGLYARYAPAFAKEAGIQCPPFKDIRRYGAAFAALIGAMPDGEVTRA